MRRYAIVGALLLATGCLTEVEQTSCSSDADCPKVVRGDALLGSACLRSDVSLEGVCVACRDACTAPGETCAYGVCKPKFRLVQPASNAELGGQVKIVVEAQPGTREELPEQVKVVAQFGPTGESQEFVLARQRDEGGNWTSRYESDPVLNHDGPYVLTVVLVPDTSTVSTGTNVSNDGCEPACPAGQECLAQACTPTFGGLVIDAPTSQLLNTRQFPVAATLTRATNTVLPGPETLTAELRTPDGATTLSTATLRRTAVPDKYAGNVTAPDDGLYLLVLSAGPGPTSAPFTLRVDTTPPVLSLALVDTVGATGDPAYPTTGETALYFRRDQTVTLRVDSNELLGWYKFAIKVSSEGYAADHFVAPASNVQLTQGCTSAQCQTGKLNLFDGNLPMKSFRQVLKVRAEGFDRAGNQAFSEERLIQVTRWKWKADLGSYVTTEPALGSDGTLYLASAGGSLEPGKLFRVGPSGQHTSVELGQLFRPSDVLVARIPGATADTATDAVVVAGLAGTSNVVRLVRGQEVGTVSCDNALSGMAERSGALALMSNPPMLVGVVQPPLLNGSTAPAKFVRALLTSDAPSTACATFEPPSGAFQLPRGAQLAVQDKLLYAPDTQGNLQAWTLSDPLANTWTASAPVPVSTTGTVNEVLFAGSDLLGTLQTTETQGGSFFKVGNTARPAAVAPAHLVHSSKGFAIGSSGDSLHWFRLDLFPTLKTTAPVPLSGPIVGAPVVGKDGSVYAVTSNASLAVLDAYGVKAWSLDSTSPASTAGVSLLLDCSRSDSGAPLARPGVLYVVESGGTVFAAVVDSRGLDAASSWPVAGRDPYRSRNTAYDRAAFTCP